MLEAFTLDAEAVQAADEACQKRARALPEQQRRRYHQLCHQRLKDPDTYAVLNWFFIAGLHHFYLGKIRRGAVNLAIMALGVTLMTLGELVFGALALTAVFLIELPALLRSQTIVAAHNVRIAEVALEEARSS